MLQTRKASTEILGAGLLAGALLLSASACGSQPDTPLQTGSPAQEAGASEGSSPTDSTARGMMPIATRSGIKLSVPDGVAGLRTPQEVPTVGGELGGVAEVPSGYVPSTVMFVQQPESGDGVSGAGGYLSVSISDDDQQLVQLIKELDAAKLASALGFDSTQVSFAEVGTRSVVTIERSDVATGKDLGFEDRATTMRFFLSADGSAIVFVATDTVEPDEVSEYIGRIEG